MNPNSLSKLLQELAEVARPTSAADAVIANLINRNEWMSLQRLIGDVYYVARVSDGALITPNQVKPLRCSRGEDGTVAIEVAP